MNDEKRLVLAVALSIAVIVGWNMFFTKPYTEDLSDTPRSEQQEKTEKDRSEPYQVEKPASDFKPETRDRLPDNKEIPELKKRNFRTIAVSTPLYNLSLSEDRATVTNYTLKKYKESNKNNAASKALISDKIKNGVFDIDFKNNTIPGIDSAVFKADKAPDDITVEKGERTVRLAWTSQDNVVVEKIFTFHADSYLIDCDVVLKNGSGMQINDSIVISVPAVPEESDSKMSRFAFKGPALVINEKLEEIDLDDIEEKGAMKGQIAWTGYTDRYFLSCVIPEKSDEGEVRISKSDDRVITDFLQHFGTLNPGKQITLPFDFYMGPKSHRILKSYNNSLKKAVNFGWTNFLAKPLLITMNFIYQIVPNYGLAIILLTILIKVVFWPLGTKSYKSMNEMKKVQPLMKEIREKYKDDKQKINQEVMALYKTYKVNPLSGCLPMLVQLPIFLALYRMLYQAIELRHAPFFGWIQDLSAPDRLFHFDFAIPLMQPPYGIPVLTIIMGVTFFFQQKMTPTGTGDPTQQKIMMLMPIFLTVIFINFPAGLVLYIFANNIISMGQQYYIQKKFS